ncbi:DUF4911 domain-containing protein|uniref:DUF4911 domain-containing protein n=1 Tax=Dendrosporobacter quercicolus TaxID=146817 RepID=A0A1G9KU58_9FIRM|nr:DUF4911 domain-containing protein [Dendrosporobacter quercicolus]NSL46507.1 DUF4911 domain-containing protein [Dendrosporobacter quercicolus DSM 1736]SDL53400.1 protein of unknown function [Dendrosporobacter quercicolus]
MNNALYLRIDPQHVNYLNRIMEGYEYLGTVSTVDRKAGIVVIRATADTVAEVRTIIENLTIPFAYVEKELTGGK